MYTKQLLDNQISLVTERIDTTYSVALSIWVRTGSKHEQVSNRGVSHFLEHLLFKGTKRRSARQIAEEIEAIGGSINAFTTKEYTCFYTKVLAEHFARAADILSDMFFNSLMRPEDVEREKRVVLEEIKMYEDSPDELVHDLFVQSLWDGHPLGWTILGTKDSVSGLTAEIIRDYYRRRYCATNIVLAVAGNVSEEEVVARYGKLFSRLAREQCEEVSIPKVVAQPRVEVIRRKTEQVHVCLGTSGISQEDEDIYVLKVMNNIFGGGLSSRLFQRIREEKGLAYSVYSYHASYKDGGLFCIYVGTSPAQVEPVVRLIMEEISSLKKTGVTREELNRAKEQIRGNLLLGMENTANRMMRLGKTETCYGRVITVEEALARLAEVTEDRVRALAERLFRPEAFALTAIGPLKRGIALKSIIGDVGL